MENRSLSDYCQVVKVSGADGLVKELYFPKALDLTRPKRPRTTFSARQLDALEREFRKSAYLVGGERKKLAKRLSLSETQIKVWYQNRRTKCKVTTVGESESEIESRQNTFDCDEGEIFFTQNEKSTEIDLQIQ